MHERHAALFGMILVELTTLGAHFILRRQREFVDARHARALRTLRHWRHEGGRHRLFGGQSFPVSGLKQRWLHWHRPNGDVFFHRSRWKDGGRDSRMRR